MTAVPEGQDQAFEPGRGSRSLHPIINFPANLDGSADLDPLPTSGYDNLTMACRLEET